MNIRHLRAAAILMLTSLSWLSAQLPEETITSVDVLRVIDGDTIVVRHLPANDEDSNNEDSLVTVRLYGVDAPELDQPGGGAASQFVREWIAERSILLKTLDTDWFGRVIGEIISENRSEDRSLNEEMVYQGHAWWYREYASEDDKLQKLEANARNNERGLWEDENPTPPWVWR